MTEPAPERPLECSECKKKLSVFYTEIVGKMMYRIAMCNTCPVLQQKLFGLAYPKVQAKETQAGLCCGSCTTTIDELHRGASIGCSLCYEVFEEFLIQELISTQKVPPKVAAINKFAPLHRGKQPGELKKIDPTSQLMVLHQALNETLGREEYEQAAWLRDQIKILTEGLKNDITES